MNDLQIFLILVCILPLTFAMCISFYFAELNVDVIEFFESGAGIVIIPFVIIALIIYISFLNIINTFKKDK